MERDMVGDSFIGILSTRMMENGRMMSQMGLVDNCMRMETSTKDSFCMGKETGQEYIFLAMVISTMEHLQMKKWMEKVFMNAMTEVKSQELGMLKRIKIKELYFMLMEIVLKENIDKA